MRKGVSDTSLVRGGADLLLLGGLLRSLGDLATLLCLVDGLNDTDGNGLPHITDGETTERRVLIVGLNTHGLAGDKLGNARITGLDELGRGLNNLSAPPVNLLKQLGELASNVGGMTIQDRSVTRANLTGVVEDDNLGVEGSGLLGRVVLGVGGDISTADILDRDVLDIEADVITRLAGFELLVVHLDRLHFSGNVGWGEGNDHAGLNNTSLDTTDGHRSNTANLVNILEGETERLVGRTGRGLDGINGVQEGLTLDGTGLGLSGPALVPRHVGGLLQHVVPVPSGDGDKGDGLGVVSDLFDEVGGFLDDFVETFLAPLGGVHLVDGHDELPHTKGESEQSVLSGLTILGDTSLEFTSTGGNDENSAISLGGTSDHVFDEVTVSRSINDSNHEFRSLELPEGDIDSDTTLTFGLQLVQDPGILEGTLAELSGFLLELFNSTLVDTTALVDQVPSSGRLSGIDVSDDDYVNVGFILSHSEDLKKRK